MRGDSNRAHASEGDKGGWKACKRVRYEGGSKSNPLRTSFHLILQFDFF